MSMYCASSQIQISFGPYLFKHRPGRLFLSVQFYPRPLYRDGLKSGPCHYYFYFNWNEMEGTPGTSPSQMQFLHV